MSAKPTPTPQQQAMRRAFAASKRIPNALEQHGWRVVEWFKAGFLKGGMAQQKGGGKHQQGRERLWLSPHCLGAAEQAQGGLFALEEAA